MSEDRQLVGRVIEQAFDLWINPELERRTEDGRLPKAFKLQAAQVILYMGDTPPDVRLNEEVRIAIGVEAEGPIESGDLVQVDPRKIQKMILTARGSQRRSSHAPSRRCGLANRLRLSV